MEVERSIGMAVAPEKVWPFLVEPEKVLQWCITFRKFEYSGEQRSGVGTTFYVEEKAGGPLMKLNFVVTEWVDNETLAFRMTSGSGVKSYEQKWAIAATPSGSRFTFMEQVELPFGVIGRLLSAMVQRSSEAHVEQMLLTLRKLVEA